MTDIPRSAVVRTAKLASLPLSLAGRTALGFGKRVTGVSAEAVAAQMQARTAEQLFKVLGELKGGAMKFGQALSVFEAALPDDLAGPYRATLTKLQDAAPPMPASTVHGVLDRDLGAGWRDRFRSFDDVPAAAASIGQVHRGVWHDGRAVAVKVQYPGASDALLSDIAQLSRVGRVAAGWIPGLDVKPILEEMKVRLVEELNYTLEAEAQNTFAEAFEGDEHFAVPHVLEAGQHVIISEWLEGVALNRLIADGAPEDRDLVGRRYLEFLLAGPARAGLLHADPHPGNFRLLPDGRFGILDFGAVKRLPEGMPPQIGRLLTLGLQDDGDAVVAGLRDEGFIKSSIELHGDDLIGYLAPFMEPLKHTDWTFDRDWMRSLFGHINDVRRPDWSLGLKLNLPPEYFLIHRVWTGGIGVLCQIDATIPVLEVFAEMLPGFDAEALDYIEWVDDDEQDDEAEDEDLSPVQA